MHMRKYTYYLIIGVGLLVIGGGLFLFSQALQKNQLRTGQSPYPQEETAARNLVERFGRALKSVSVLAPKDIAAQSIREQYAPYLAPDLLAQWIQDPSKALGRSVSSPWPDRIEIRRAVKSGNGYAVYGDIIEITSVEQAQGGEADRRSIEADVRNADDRLYITSVSAGAYDASSQWNSTTTDGIAFSYPEKLGVQYIRPAQWPPRISVSSGAYSCNQTPPASSLPERIMEMTINGQAYCVGAASQGAAGSIYTDYSYATRIGDRTVTAMFALQYPQCLNYDDQQRTACQRERETFDLNNLADRIVSSVQL